MRDCVRTLLFLAAALFLATSAMAEPLASIVFSGNTWGFFKPCPT